MSSTQSLLVAIGAFLGADDPDLHPQPVFTDSSITYRLLAPPPQDLCGLFIEEFARKTLEGLKHRGFKSSRLEEVVLYGSQAIARAAVAGMEVNFSVHHATIPYTITVSVDVHPESPPPPVPPQGKAPPPAKPPRSARKRLRKRPS